MEKTTEKSDGGETEKEKEHAKERSAWEKEKSGWVTDKTEQARQNEGLRVHELEVVEFGWKQVRGIFTTERMDRGGT